MVLKFMKREEGAIIPSFANGDPYNAGFDFYSLQRHSIYPKCYAIVDTGIAWDGMSLVADLQAQGKNEKPYIQIKSRSGLAFNYSVEASNAGVIDATYTGSIKIKLYNNGESPIYIEKGHRIAQGILLTLPYVHIVETAQIAETTRGSNGFGSTGDK